MIRVDSSSWVFAEQRAIEEHLLSSLEPASLELLLLPNSAAKINHTETQRWVDKTSSKQPEPWAQKIYFIAGVYCIRQIDLRVNPRVVTLLNQNRNSVFQHYNIIIDEKRDHLRRSSFSSARRVGSLNRSSSPSLRSAFGGATSCPGLHNDVVAVQSKASSGPAMRLTVVLGHRRRP